MGTTGEHTAIIVQGPEGYWVQCPYGCNLGTSAHAPDRQAAQRRVDLHKIATRAHVPACPSGEATS